MEGFVCMSAALSAAGNIIEIVHPFDSKINVIISFNKSEISSAVLNLREIDKPTKT